MSVVPTSLPNAALCSGYFAYEVPIQVSTPRSVLAIGTTDILVLERGTSSVVHLFDSDGDGLPDSKRTIATGSNLNHGLALHDNYIYASSDTTVYRWPYDGGDASFVGTAEVVVDNINADGMGGAPQGHRTRTLVFDPLGRLYVSVGSNGNVDADSYRSRIRRFDLTNTSLPQDFQTGDVFADGLRNEVGLAFDKHGILWGVENGADNLFRSDLGGDIHNDNPAEELNRFREEDAGKHWGYPYCWTEYELSQPPGLGRGTVWAWPSFISAGSITDQLCRDEYIAPELSMQGHSAPLGITFYEWTPPDLLPSECNGDYSIAFPQEMDGFAFIAFHGSWNRDIPTGYKVVYVPMNSNGDVLGEPIDFLAHEAPGARWEDGFRPVDVDFDACGRLIVSSDGTRGKGSKIVRIDFTNHRETSAIDSLECGQDSHSPSISSSKNPTQIPSSVTPTPSQCIPTSERCQDQGDCLFCGSPSPSPDSSSRKSFFISSTITAISSIIIVLHVIITC